MAENFVGEIRQFAGTFAPAGWALCDGSVQAISDNDTLYVLIGTTYGGDGVNTFNLPDLRGRVPIHQGTDPSGIPYVMGQQGGTENVTLNAGQVASHSHVPVAAVAGSSGSPSGNVWAGTGTTLSYGTAPGTAAMNVAAIGMAGGGQSHPNTGPYQAVNYIISLYGIFPSQS